MATSKNSYFLYNPLPAEVYGKQAPMPEKALLKLIASDVPKTTFEANKTDLLFRMFTKLPRHPKERKPRNRKKYLSKKLRKEHNLDRLPKQGWNYESLQEMRNMWLAYVNQCLACGFQSDSVPDITDKYYMNFHAVMAKIELTGANILVVKSKNPSCVGIEGTIVLETQQTFQVVTPSNQLKILLKPASVFVFRIGSKEFTIYGQSLLIRPHERCVKKLKSYIKLDL